MKLYVCRRIRLLSYLQGKGFNFIKTEPDKNNPKYTVWLFVETDDLRSAVEEYYNAF